MQYRTIEIDFDVHKRIELERTSFSESANAVLRRLLGIKGDETLDRRTVESPTSETGRPWAGKGVTLPHGTEVRMEYNGRVHTGVIEDGEWLVEGKRFKSPSAAAGGVARTKSGNPTSLDGWLYWFARIPGEAHWKRLRRLRARQHTASSPEPTTEKTEEVEMTVASLRNSALPTENDVIIALEEYLQNQTRPVTPADAYLALAMKFDLTREQRNRMMPNADEVHWENRVRQARRKLVDAGKIDPNLPRGLWAIRKQPSR